MFWTIGELCYLQWETIYYLAGASGELHCLVWKESKWKVWCSLKWITQPRINLYLMHVDTDFFHFCYTELITRACTSSCIWYSDSLPELMKCPRNCVCFLLPSDKNKMYCLHSLLLTTESSCSHRTINFFSFLAPKRYISCLSFTINLNWI